MLEEWKEIKKYEGVYSISNIGNVKNNLTEKILNQRLRRECQYITTKLNNKEININVKKEFIFAFFDDEDYQLYRNIDGNLKNISVNNFRKENRKYKGNVRNTYKIIGNYVEVYTDKMETFLIDLENLDLIDDYKWYKRNDGYISCSAFGKNGKNMFLHRAIMSKNNNIKGMNIDHINRKRNDNRKENLRVVTTQQNNFNQSIGKGNTSGLLGVIKVERQTKKKGNIEDWRANIKYNGKHISKQFKTKEEAIKWRLQKELEYYGKDFAPQRHLFKEYGIKELTC